MNIHNKEQYKCCNFTIIELPVNDIKVRITKDFVYLDQVGMEIVVNRDEAVNVFESIVKAIREAE